MSQARKAWNTSHLSEEDTPRAVRWTVRRSADAVVGVPTARIGVTRLRLLLVVVVVIVVVTVFTGGDREGDGRTGAHLFAGLRARAE